MTLGLIPSMTNFHLSFNSILWFCGEVVAKNNKRTGRTTGLGLGEECIGKWNPDPVEGSWPSAGSSPLPSLSRGWISRKRSLSSLRTQYCLHAPVLLPSCSLAPGSLGCLCSQDYLKAPNKIIIYPAGWKGRKSGNSLREKWWCISNLTPSWPSHLRKRKWVQVEHTDTLLSYSHTPKQKASQIAWSCSLGQDQA